MPGFNATALNYKVLNGNGCAVLIGDQPIAFAQSFSMSIDFGADALYGIGNSKPQEVQQLKFSMSVSLDGFKLTQEGIQVLGYPSDISEVLANNSFNIAALDAAGNVIRTAVGCVANSLSTSVPANQIVSESISFTAQDMLDPNGVSLLNGNDALTLTTLASTAVVASAFPQ